MNFKINFYSKRGFCELLGNFISRKSGQKCCVYGQNGKPLSKETVQIFLNNLYTNVNNKALDSNLSEFAKSRKLIDWAANEDYTRLFRLFYFKNVFLLTDFIREIYNVDYQSNLQQIPNISVSNQELLKIELYTPALKGLAMRDLQLAVGVNSLNFNKYKLIPLKDERNYKREIRLINLEEERIKNELGAGIITDRTKLKNKYDGLIYEHAMLNKEPEDPTGCSNPEGCACSKAKSSKY